MGVLLEKIKSGAMKKYEKAGDKLAKLSKLSPGQIEDLQEKREKYLSQMPSMDDEVAIELTSRYMAASSVEVFNSYLEQIKNVYLPEEFSSEYNDDKIKNRIAYFDITKWVSDKKENNLEKLINVYQVLENEDCNIALVFQRKKEQCHVYLGVFNNSENADGNIADSYLKRIQVAIKGNFPGSHMGEIKKGVLEFFSDNNNDYSVATISNVPSEKSEKFISQTIEKLLDGIVPEDANKEYTLILLATPIHDVEYRKTRLGEIYTSLAPYAGWQTSYTFTESDATNALANFGVNVGVSAGIQAGRNQGTNNSEGVTDSTGTTNTDSTADTTTITNTEGSSDTVGGAVSVGASQYAGASVGMGGTGVSAGASTNQSVTANYNHGWNRSASESMGKTIGKAVAKNVGHALTNTIGQYAGTSQGINAGANVGANFARSSSITATVGCNESITQSFTNYNIKHLLENLEKQMERMDISSALGMWDFAAYVVSKDNNITNNVAHMYEALTQGEDSFMSHAAINTWRGDASDPLYSAKEEIEKKLLECKKNGKTKINILLALLTEQKLIDQKKEEIKNELCNLNKEKKNKEKEREKNDEINNLTTRQEEILKSIESLIIDKTNTNDIDELVSLCKEISSNDKEYKPFLDKLEGIKKNLASYEEKPFLDKAKEQLDELITSSKELFSDDEQSNQISESLDKIKSNLSSKDEKSSFNDEIRQLDELITSSKNLFSNDEQFEQFSTRLDDIRYNLLSKGEYLIKSLSELLKICQEIKDILYSGSNYLNSREKEQAEEIFKYIRTFQHPIFSLNEKLIEDEDATFLVYPLRVTSTTALSGKELAYSLNFPSKSVSGLSVLECASFGRNISTYDLGKQSEELIVLGRIFHMNHEEELPVTLDSNSLTSHVFVTGSTGSGKSNTVYQILSEAKEKEKKFLVIEPAKGEYKNVFGNKKDVKVYGTNRKLTKLLKINPFSFPKDIHVLEHMDRLVEIFNVCWPMYAAMPAILKEAIEKSYEDAGWDLTESSNPNGEVFPTFADVLQNIKIIIDTSEYDAQNKGAYKGSLLTRLKSLTNGLNGQIFTSQGISDSELFDENVIIDLSRVGSQETKALLMGILVLKLQEHRMAKANQNEMNADLKHITVLEEAHNLLKRTSTEQSAESSNLAGKSVEMLTNAIAEMRTYGEGFIIADQTPALLDMAVIRNTNTKIIMRLPDLTDRELVGKAANLNDEQIIELAKLPCGVAAVYQNEWVEAVLCKVKKYENHDTFTPESDDVNIEELNQKRINIATFLSKGEKLPVVDSKEKLDSVNISIIAKNIAIEYLQNPPTEPRMTKLAPIMAALFPKAYEATKNTYVMNQDNPALWTNDIINGLQTHYHVDKLNMDEQVRRDVVQALITQYVFNEIHQEAKLEEWTKNHGF